MTSSQRQAGPITWAHQSYIHSRRIKVLAAHLADLLVDRAKVLDVGCGDGLLAAAIGQLRPDLTLRGIDVLVRENTAIDVASFDGRQIPFESNSFDAVMLVDVLHHTLEPRSLLAEAARVASRQIVLKDHYLRGIAAGPTLAFMDKVGNERHGVEIPRNYLTPSQWQELYRATEVRQIECREKLGLYPPPIDWIFGRGLHFVASFEPEGRQ